MPALSSWCDLPDPNRARWHGRSTWIPHFRVFIRGGYDEEFKKEYSVELLREPDTCYSNAWNFTAPVLEPSRYYLTAQINGLVFALDANTWPPRLQMLNLRDYPNAEWN